MVRILIASHEEDILGGLLLLTFGKRATFLYGGITNTKRQLMAGYALQWRAIEIAKGLGCDTYDFYGYTEFDDQNHDYAKFSRFKRQFGGKMEKFIGAHDHFFLDRLADVVIKAVNQIERKWSMKMMRFGRIPPETITLFSKDNRSSARPHCLRTSC